MKNDEVFNRDQSLIFKSINRVKSVKKNVIKRDQVVFGEKRKIEHSLQVSETNHDGKVTPVLNDDEVIGIIYECSCGKVAQILFDFEETSEVDNQAATG